MHSDNTHDPTAETEMLLSIAEAAKRLMTSEWTIHKLIRDRELPSMKIGARRLIAVDDLRSFIQSKRVPTDSGAHHG